MATRKKANREFKPAAATAEILNGGSNPEGKIDSRWRKHYSRLMQLRTTLTARQTEATNDALSEQPAYSMHMADAGTDNFDRDMALSILSSEQDAIYEIDEALDRIRRGQYGICELTGKPIEPGRLEAVPWTRFSAEAERELEREGEIKRTHLGGRETVGREPTAKAPEDAS